MHGMLQGKTGVGDDAQVKESVEPDTWCYIACCRARQESEMMLKLRKALSLILGCTCHVTEQDRSRR